VAWRAFGTLALTLVAAGVVLKGKLHQEDVAVKKLHHRYGVHCAWTIVRVE
jgi:hypothetical protein